jgi:hypothetical protein
MHRLQQFLLIHIQLKFRYILIPYKYVIKKAIKVIHEKQKSVSWLNSYLKCHYSRSSILLTAKQ